MVSWREREALNEARFRLQNEWINGATESFGDHAPTDTYVCECGDADCAQPLELTHAETNRCAPSPPISWSPQTTRTPKPRSSCASAPALPWSTSSRVGPCASPAQPTREAALSRWWSHDQRHRSCERLHHDGNGTWLITLEGEHDLATPAQPRAADHRPLAAPHLCDRGSVRPASSTP